MPEKPFRCADCGIKSSSPNPRTHCMRHGGGFHPHRMQPVIPNRSHSVELSIVSVTSQPPPQQPQRQQQHHYQQQRPPARPSCSEIIPGLYVGDKACIKDEAFIRSMGFTAIISVLSKPLAAHENNILSRTIPNEDRVFCAAADDETQNLIRYFPVACEFIDKRLVCLTSRWHTHN